jgi:lysophospholipase L1-like esterase
MLRMAKRARRNWWSLAGITAVALAIMFAGYGLVVVSTRSTDVPTSAYVPNTPQYNYLPVSVIGDSYANGSGASTKGRSWADLLNRQMCWRMTKDSQPGTGYVAVGAAENDHSPYTNRFAKITEDDPALIIVQGSTNDAGKPGVFEAAVDFYRVLHERAPEARIIAIGPTAAPSVNYDSLVAVRDQLRNAAAVSDVTFIDPLQEGWLSDETLYSTDRLHPTDAGHEQFAASARADLETMNIDRLYACDAVPSEVGTP